MEVSTSLILCVLGFSSGFCMISSNSQRSLHNFSNFHLASHSPRVYELVIALSR
jgi:hypothetical protein